MTWIQIEGNSRAKYRSMKAGQTFVGLAGLEMVVQKPCDLDVGKWYCASCKIVLFNNMQKDNHIGNAGKHELVWFCGEHGPEAVKDET